MRRSVLLRWVISLAVWFILGHLLAWAFLHISWDVLLWLQHGTMWTLRKIEQPGYNPDGYDVEGALDLLLFVMAYLISTAIVVPASIIVWHRTRLR